MMLIDLGGNAPSILQILLLSKAKGVRYSSMLEEAIVEISWIDRNIWESFKKMDDKLMYKIP